MKKKLLALLLAGSMMCTSGGITWAAAEAPIDVFDSEPVTTAEDATGIVPQEETSGEGVAPTADETSVDEISTDTEIPIFQAAAADFSDGTNELQEIETFTSGEDDVLLFSGGGQNNGSDVLVVGDEVTVSPDENGKDSFTFNAGVEGIYQFEYSSYDIHMETSENYGTYGNKKFIVRLSSGSHTINCTNLTGEVTITAVILPDIKSVEIVETNFPTYYNGELPSEINATLKIADINGHEELTDDGGYSETYGVCGNWIDSDTNQMYLHMFSAPNIEVGPIQLNYKNITESDPQVIGIGDNTVSATEANNYCFQFTTPSEGPYKIKLNNGTPFDDKSPYLDVREIADSSVAESVFRNYLRNEATVSLKANTKYFARVITSGFTGDLPVSITTTKAIQSFRLAEGEKLPTEMIDWYTEVLPGTKFVIGYSDGTTEEVAYGNESSEYGKILMSDINGKAVFFLENDNDWEEQSRYVTGPNLVNFETATAMTDISMGSANSISTSTVYLDGAYFKFQAPSNGNYVFNITGAKTVHTSGNSYESDDDIKIPAYLSQGKSIYFIAKNMTADAVKVEVEKKPDIKSITLKSGNIEGKTFVRDILNDYGITQTIAGCMFEVTYSDGTPSELVSLDWANRSQYYGSLSFYTDAYVDGSIQSGDKNVWVGFESNETTSPKYNIHIVDKPAVSETPSVSLDQERTLTKGIHDLQWFAFTAPADGSYLFRVNSATGDISDSCDYYWTKESVVVTRAAQASQWEYDWGMRPVAMKAGETLRMGISAADAVTVKPTAVKTLEKIELAEGESLSSKYIKEFLQYNSYLPVRFKASFSEGEPEIFSIGETIIKDGINYGDLDCYWPQDENYDYISGELQVYAGNTYVEGRDFKQAITVVNLADATDLPTLTASKPITTMTPSNYNNTYCFAYTADTAGTYEFIFTPNSTQQTDENNGSIRILKNGKYSSTYLNGESSVIRNFTKDETAYFICSQCDYNVTVKAADAEKQVNKLLVTPSYGNILYDGSFDLQGWKFELEFNNGNKSEPVYSRFSSFDKYGDIDAKLGNGDNIDADDVAIGKTTIQFSLSDFPEIKSEPINIEIKKASDMGFTALTLGVESSLENAVRYADSYAAIFTPKENGTYQYAITNAGYAWDSRIIGDEGYVRSIYPPDDNSQPSEGVFRGQAGSGYAFLVPVADDDSPKPAIIITKIDKSKLQSLYEANKNRSSSGYTTSSWNRFAQALDAAETVLYTNSSLQQEIDKALNNLQAAVNGLTQSYYPPSVDKSSLRKLYDTGNKYQEADYTAASWKVLQDALKTAKNILDTSSSQTAIDQAEKTLKDAIAALVKAADRSALKTAYDKYKTYKKDDYTPTTWSSFEKALVAAGAGIGDKDLTADDAAKLLDDLEKAAAGLLKVGIPVIKNIKVNGNKAVVSLNDAVEKADGYDFVVGNKNCITSKKYADVRKNIKTLNAEFKYAKKGTYYAYCHAWKRVNGKKVFGPWSEPFKFTITATTPSTPKIKSISVNGNTVTVVLQKIKGVTSYDAILGTTLGKDSIYGNRPFNYEKYVIKSKSNKIVFKNVKKGTYYFGIHAANRSSTDKKKVFSKWTTKKIIIK